MRIFVLLITIVASLALGACSSEETGSTELMPPNDGFETPEIGSTQFVMAEPAPLREAYETPPPEVLSSPVTRAGNLESEFAPRRHTELDDGTWVLMNHPVGVLFVAENGEVTRVTESLGSPLVLERDGELLHAVYNHWFSVEDGELEASPRVFTIDITDPSSPQLVRESALRGYVADAFVSQGLLRVLILGIDGEGRTTHSIQSLRIDEQGTEVVDTVELDPGNEFEGLRSTWSGGYWVLEGDDYTLIIDPETIEIARIERGSFRHIEGDVAYFGAAQNFTRLSAYDIADISNPNQLYEVMLGMAPSDPTNPGGPDVAWIEVVNGAWLRVATYDDGTRLESLSVDGTVTEVSSLEIAGERGFTRIGEDRFLLLTDSGEQGTALELYEVAEDGAVSLVDTETSDSLDGIFSYQHAAVETQAIDDESGQIFVPVATVRAGDTVANIPNGYATLNYGPEGLGDAVGLVEPRLAHGAALADSGEFVTFSEARLVRGDASFDLNAPRIAAVREMGDFAIRRVLRCDQDADLYEVIEDLENPDTAPAIASFESVGSTFWTTEDRVVFDVQLGFEDSIDTRHETWDLSDPRSPELMGDRVEVESWRRKYECIGYSDVDFDRGFPIRNQAVIGDLLVEPGLVSDEEIFRYRNLSGDDPGNRIGVPVPAEALGREVEEGTVFDGARAFRTMVTPLEGGEQPTVKYTLYEYDFGDPSEADFVGSYDVPGRIISAEGRTIITAGYLWNIRRELVVSVLELEDGVARLQAVRRFENRLNGQVEVSDDRVIVASDASPQRNERREVVVLDAQTLDEVTSFGVAGWLNLASTADGFAGFTTPHPLYWRGRNVDGNPQLAYFVGLDGNTGEVHRAPGGWWRTRLYRDTWLVGGVYGLHDI